VGSARPPRQNPTEEKFVRRKWIVSLVVLFLIVIAGIMASQFSLTALPEPGRTETYVATRAKHFLVARESRSVPDGPASAAASVTEGDKLYGAECAMCHGLDAQHPTGRGRWMYPRASDLTSAETQGYSDKELFWIIRNGIRLSGMPAFGKVESNEHIWNLVHYLRSLKPAVRQG
jgi:mono/diheme cytochrome c family protein